MTNIAMTLRLAGAFEKVLVPLANPVGLGGAANSVGTFNTAAIAGHNNNNRGFRRAANSVGTLNTAAIEGHNNSDRILTLVAQIQALGYNTKTA